MPPSIRLRSFPFFTAIIPFLFSEAAFADIVTDWNIAIETCDATHPSAPFAQARRFAMAHPAMANAMQAAAQNDPRAAAQQPARDLAGAVAAHRVLVTPLPAQKISFDAVLARERLEFPSSPQTERAAGIGTDAAMRVLASREKDGLAQALVAVSSPPEGMPALPTTHAGRPPAMANRGDTGWRLVVPLVLKNARQFRAVAPFGPDENDRFHGLSSFTMRGVFTSSDAAADDPLLVARFWDDSATLTWNRIARILADRDGHPPEIRARLFATLHVALVDAFTAGRESRAYFAAWRQSRATILTPEFDGPIREDGDSGPHPAQNYLLETTAGTETVPAPLPPVPDHPPLSAIAAGAAEMVLVSFFDRDAIDWVCDTPGSASASPLRRRSHRRSQAGIFWKGVSRVIVSAATSGATYPGARQTARDGPDQTPSMLCRIWDDCVPRSRHCGTRDGDPSGAS